MARLRELVRGIGPKGRGEWTLFFAGVNLMLLNFILVQHLSVAYRQAELAVLLFSLAYFSGISLGYLVSDRVSRGALRWILPASLLVQLAVIVFGQAGVYILSRDLQVLADDRGLGEHFGRYGAYVVGYVVLTLGATSVYSIFLPAAIDEGGGDLRRMYGVELLGSIAGLLLVPVLASISHTWLLGGYLAVFCALAWAVRLPRLDLAALSVLSVAFLLGAQTWDQQLGAWFYDRWYAGREIERVEYTRYTPYHKIEVARFGGDHHMLFLNGKRQFAYQSHERYSFFVAEVPARLLRSPRTLVLGCGSMSTVGRIGDRASSITIVDIDPEVFRTSKRYFGRYNRLSTLTNWRFVADDAKHYVANGDDRFDLILHDIPPARSRQVALTYTREFFELVKARLEPHGIFSIASLTPLSGRSAYGRRMLATLTAVFDRYCVVLLGGSAYFYGGGSDLQVPEAAAILAAIGEHPDRTRVRILRQEEVDSLCRDARVVTIENTGDLIFDD